MGRPNTYNPDTHPQIAEGLARRGLTLEEIASVFGKSVRTLARWAADNPDFRQALKQGRDDADARVEQSLFSRAIGGQIIERRTVTRKGGDEEYIEKLAPSDTTACIFWLKNRRPDSWRDKANVELTGADGGPIQHDFTDTETASLIEEAVAIAREAAATCGAGSGDTT